MPVEVDVVKVKLDCLEESDVPAVPPRGDVDDPEEVGTSELGPEQVGEIEMCEMVDSPVHLNRFFGQLPGRNAHHARVINQVVDPLLPDDRREALNGGTIGQVQGDKVH